MELKQHATKTILALNSSGKKSGDTKHALHSFLKSNPEIPTHIFSPHTVMRQGAAVHRNPSYSSYKPDFERYILCCHSFPKIPFLDSDPSFSRQERTVYSILTLSSRHGCYPAPQQQQPWHPKNRLFWLASTVSY